MFYNKCEQEGNGKNGKEKIGEHPQGNTGVGAETFRPREQLLQKSRTMGTGIEIAYVVVGCGRVEQTSSERRLAFGYWVGCAQ
jgi:hypothetical protein